MLNDNERRQDLGNAGRIVNGMQIFSIDHSAGVGVHQDSPLCFHRDIGRPFGGRICQGGLCACDQYNTQKQGQNSFHFYIS